METPTSLDTSPKEDPGDGHEMDQIKAHEDRGPGEATSSFPEGAVTEKAEVLPDIVDGDKDEYPRGLALAVIIIGLCLSVLLVALDNTILVTAIPKIVNILGLLSHSGLSG